MNAAALITMRPVASVGWAALAGCAACAGWAAAILAATLAAGVLRTLHAQREAAVRAAHELRGPLTAIGLAVELEARQRLDGHAWGGVELELARATLALDDLTRVPARAGLALDDRTQVRAPAGLARDDRTRLPSRGRKLSRLGLRLRPRRARPQRARHLDRVAIHPLIEACAVAARARADVAGVALTVEWSDPEAHVWGERLRLAQALGNLISNAVEYGAGAVSIRGQAAANRVRVVIDDHGPGLPAPVAELAGRARAGVGERGRGLAIALAIIEQHGGRLGSAPSERGARLVLELPAA